VVGGGRERRRKRKEQRVDAETVDLSGSEHAWWAAREDLDGGVPHGRRRRSSDQDASAPPTGRVFNDYFSTQSLYETPTDDEGPMTPEQAPYAVLGVPETATWEEITAAHRRLAKVHHPDRLLHPTAAERRESEARIRDLNIAYSELRRRRGK
jgi:DnaJ-class molecular chaperone